MSRSEWCNLRKNLPSVALKVKKKEFIGKECGPPWESGKEKPWILPRWRGKNNGDERQNKIVKQSKQNGNPKGKGAKNREMLVVMTH